MINIGTNDAKLRDQVRKRLKLLSAIKGQNQDAVLLKALNAYLKQTKGSDKLTEELNSF